MLSAVGGSAPVPSERAVVQTSFRSHALGTNLHLVAVLPPGYRTNRVRYPVVYFLHGLPASSQGYRGVGLVAGRIGAGAILVAPQGARDTDTDPEYLDRGPGHRWETAIAQELPRFVDHRFRTIRSRRARALVGVSAGGYGAALLTLHHLDAFSVVESWGGYFHPTDPSGWRALDLGSAAANRRASAHSLVGTLRRQFAKQPTFFAFYVGRDDRRFRHENEQLDTELDRAAVRHIFRLYPGGHEQRVWAQHARKWLALALSHLSKPRPPVS